MTSRLKAVIFPDEAERLSGLPIVAGGFSFGWAVACLAALSAAARR